MSGSGRRHLMSLPPRSALGQLVRQAMRSAPVCRCEADSVVSRSRDRGRRGSPYRVRQCGYVTALRLESNTSMLR